MRSLLTYILLFATLLPSISPWGTIMYYNANKDYIARVLCENRDKPQLHCDGKCYLAKKLKTSQDRQDKETTERVKSVPVMQLFCQTITPFSFPSLIVLPPFITCFNYLLMPYTAPLHGWLQPPQFKSVRSVTLVARFQ